jgi:hypothetical protein
LKVGRKLLTRVLKGHQSSEQSRRKEMWYKLELGKYSNENLCRKHRVEEPYVIPHTWSGYRLAQKRIWKGVAVLLFAA